MRKSFRKAGLNFLVLIIIIVALFVSRPPAFTENRD
jgi:hypothetical protein